jgi:hypothetical protein
MNSVFDKCANNYAMLKDLSQRLSHFPEWIYLADRSVVPMIWQLLYATSANSEGNGQVAKCSFNMLDVGMQLHKQVFGEAVFCNRAYNLGKYQLCQEDKF